MGLLIFAQFDRVAQICHAGYLSRWNIYQNVLFDVLIKMNENDLIVFGGQKIKINSVHL